MAATTKNSLVFRSAITASLGGLLFGFDTAVISGVTDSLQQVFCLDDAQLGMAVSSALVGTILGAATIQYPANRFGRKSTLLFIALLYLISAIGSAFPWNISSFIFFRFLGGIGVGGASVVSPLYTAEISPAQRRGFLVALTQFNIVLGILLAYVSNFIIAGADLGEAEWRWMLGIEAVPALVFFILLLANPESPRWLMSKGRNTEALQLFRNLTGSDDAAQEEYAAVEKALQEELSMGKESLFCWRYRKPIFLAICIAAFNQLSGVNAILYYAPKVFLMAGARPSMSMFFPTIIGLTNFVATLLAIFVIDSFGRKTLMYIGSWGYIVSLGLVGALFGIYADAFNSQIKAIDEQAAVVIERDVENSVVELEGNITAQANSQTIDDRSSSEENDGASISPIPEKEEIPKFVVLGVLVGLMVFISAHALGQGACIWVFLSEIFPNGVRAQGQALGSLVHWVLAALVSGTFPPLLGGLGPSKVFFLFMGFMVLQLVWVKFAMPETKQISLENIQKNLGMIDD